MNTHKLFMCIFIVKNKSKGKYYDLMNKTQHCWLSNIMKIFVEIVWNLNTVTPAYLKCNSLYKGIMYCDTCKDKINY